MGQRTFEMYQHLNACTVMQNGYFARVNTQHPFGYAHNVSYILEELSTAIEEKSNYVPNTHAE